jgi:hypothetical protein
MHLESRLATFSMLALSIQMTPVYSQDIAVLCGKPPKGLLLSSSSKSEINASVSNAVLSSNPEQSLLAERKIVFQKFDNPDDVFIDAYLAFVVCTIIHSGTDISTSEKVSMVNQMRVKINSVSNKSIATEESSSYSAASFSLAGFRGSIFGHGIRKDDFDKAKTMIEDTGLNFEGYNSFWTENPQSWFADSPTVFFYSNQNQQLATDFAQHLSDKLGYKFAARVGAGYGVFEGQEEYTLFVHLVQ